jgi:hypothetical protein
MCAADDLDLTDPLDFDLQQVPTDAYGVGEELQEEEQLADIFKSLLPEGPTKTTNDVEVKSKNKWGSSHRHHRHHRHTPTEGDGCSDANPCPSNCNAITDLGYLQKGMSDADIGKLYFPLDNATSQSTHSAVWYNLKGCKYIPKTRSEKFRWNVDDYVACLANKGQSYGKKCTPQMLKDGDECLMEHPYPEYKDGLFKDFWCRREPAKMKDVQCPCHSSNIKSYIDNQLTQTFEVGWAAEVEMYKRRKAKRESFRCKEGEDGDCHKPGGPSCGRSMQCRAGGFSFSPERLEQVKRQMLLNMENCVKNNCLTNDTSIDNLLDVDASFGGGSNC